MTSLIERLTELEREAARLEGASAVKRLQRAFGYSLDQGQWDEAAALFATDATLEMGLDGVFVGQGR
ncbi:MAG: nuclear transport factor 2 family protein, partial [Steroidobacteraceae bacterium]